MSLHSFYMIQHFLMGMKYPRLKDEFGLSRERGRWKLQWKTTYYNRIPESAFLDSRQLIYSSLLTI